MSDRRETPPIPEWPRVVRDATWEGGWVLHFPEQSIAIATLERYQLGERGNASS